MRPVSWERVRNTYTGWRRSRRSFGMSEIAI
jgi:hypothetical protein